MIRRLRAFWTRLRGRKPCYVCGRTALTHGADWYTGREKFIHAEHLVEGVLRRPPDSERGVRP